MDLNNYCDFYRINPRFIPVMENLPQAYWYVFQVPKNENHGIIVSGYYSGQGANSRRVDLTDIITKACVKAGLKFSAYNNAPRGGVTGNRVKIFFV